MKVKLAAKEKEKLCQIALQIPEIPNELVKSETDTTEIVKRIVKAKELYEEVLQLLATARCEAVDW